MTKPARPRSKVLEPILLWRREGGEDPVGYPAYKATVKGGFTLYAWRVFDPPHEDVHGTWAASVKIHIKNEVEQDLLFIYGRKSANQVKVDIEQNLLRHLKLWSENIKKLERPGKSR